VQKIFKPSVFFVLLGTAGIKAFHKNDDKIDNRTSPHRFRHRFPTFVPFQLLKSNENLALFWKYKQMQMTTFFLLFLLKK
jgi:hypothetical protein